MKRLGFFGLLLWAVPALSQIVLQADLSVYVNSFVGNDETGDGSEDKPFATLQHAHDCVQRNCDLAYQFTVTYQANGNFTTGVTENGPLRGQLTQSNEIYNFVSGSTVVAGTALIPGTTVQGNVAFQALYGAMFTVKSGGALTIEAPYPSGVGGAASNGGIIYFCPGLTFSNCGLSAVVTSWGGTIYLNSFFTSGDSQTFAYASGGVIQFETGQTSYIAGYPHYSVAFLWAYAGGVIGTAGHTFIGNCAGRCIRAEMCGMVSGTVPPGYRPIELYTGGQYN